MKTKSFQKYIEKRLTKEEIAEIENQVELEVKILRSIQKPIAEADEPQDIFKSKK